jgi:hypothetical protein
VGVTAQHRRRVADADLLQQLDGPGRGRPAIRPCVAADRADQDGLDGQRGVQRGDRFLEDHRDARSTRQAVALLRQVVPDPFQHHRSRVDVRGARQQPGSRSCRDALAAPRLTEQRHRLPGRDAQRDVLDDRVAVRAVAEAHRHVVQHEDPGVGG